MHIFIVEKLKDIDKGPYEFQGAFTCKLEAEYFALCIEPYGHHKQFTKITQTDVFDYADKHPYWNEQTWLKISEAAKQRAEEAEELEEAYKQYLSAKLTSRQEELLNLRVFHPPK